MAVEPIRALIDAAAPPGGSSGAGLFGALDARRCRPGVSGDSGLTLEDHSLVRYAPAVANHRWPGSLPPPWSARVAAVPATLWSTMVVSLSSTSSPATTCVQSLPKLSSMVSGLVLDAQSICPSLAKFKPVDVSRWCQVDLAWLRMILR